MTRKTKPSGADKTTAPTDEPRGRIFDKETGDTFAQIQRNLAAGRKGAEAGDESAD